MMSAERKVVLGRAKQKTMFFFFFEITCNQESVIIRLRTCIKMKMLKNKVKKAKSCFLMSNHLNQCSL